MLVLVGAGITLAGQALPSDSGADRSLSTPPPPPPPALLAPVAPVTRAAKIDIEALRPSGLRRDQRYRVKVYVNDVVARSVRLPDGEEVTLPNVPLEEGRNAIRVSLVGDGGEGDLSAPVTITRDDIAPDIRITQPALGDKVYVDSLTLFGTTEPGADITITDVATGHDLDTSIDAAGRFSASLRLALGDNRLLLRSTDSAGNHSTSRVTIVRAASSASLELTITPTELSSDTLPAHVVLTAQVRDEMGHLADAEVVFSVSPPDSETTTYRTTAKAGKARWTNLQINPGDTPGQWLVTVLAMLPSGTELRQDGSFSLR